jgi:hypothetical protein
MESPANINYEDALRAIGQGLENLRAIAFDLEYSDGEFVVSGEAKKTPTTKPVTKKSFLSLITSIASKQAPKRSSLTFHFSGIHFTAKDIMALNQKGRVRRVSGSGAPDPHSLSHVLRMAGAYLDYTESQLTTMTWCSPLLTLWLTDKRGRETKEILKLPEMYDFWVHQFKKREIPAPLKSTA